MAASESPSVVFRNTSFTIRERLTPASACSTLTRMRASLRFVRFSPKVSSPPGGFFFRLAGPLHGGLVALKSGVLVQYRSWRIGNPCLVSDLFVVRLARTGLAQEANVRPLRLDDDDVLVAMGLLLAAVVQPLFFRVFRPLAAPLGPVDDEPGRVGGRLPAL